MSDSFPLAGLVVEDETSLQACYEWMDTLNFAFELFFESIQKCRRAEDLSPGKQARAVAELRAVAKQVSEALIEGEKHIMVVTCAIAERFRDEMHAMQDPLIAIYAETPHGFRSWPEIFDQHADAIIAAYDGMKAEGRHVTKLVGAGLAFYRRKGQRQTEMPAGDASKIEAKAEAASGFIGGTTLAEVLEIHPTRRSAFARKLERERFKLGDDNWHEVQEPRPNTPRFLYRAEAPAIRMLAEGYREPKSD